MGPQGEMMGQKVAPWIGVAVAVAAAGVAAVLWMRGSSPQGTVVSHPAPLAQPSGGGAPVATPPEAVTQAPSAPDQPAASASPDGEVTQAALPAAPQIDTFSHARDGSAVLAGRAPGSTEVRLSLGEEVLASAKPDAGGRFAMLFDLAPAAQARSLILRGQAADGRQSEAVELLLAPAPEEIATTAAAADPAPMAAEVAAAPGQSTAAMPASAPAAEALAAPSSPETVEAAVVAAPLTPPASLVVSDQGVSVLRAPMPEGLSIDAIAYGAGGGVEISGRAQPESDLRIYLDNEKHLDVKTDARGGWSAGLPEVPPGLYMLRADQTATDGRVMARAETPFLREDPASLQAAAEPERSGVITVQPGFTLWGIARERFGDGVHYVKVFEANRDQIRNPDLIYPGQIFALPQE